MDYLDGIGIISWTVFHYWQLTSSSSKDRAWYNRNKSRVPFAPPGWLFGLAWFLLYGLLSASAIVFFRNSAGQIHYETVFILWTINIMLNKLWSVLFFDSGAIKSALAVAFLMFGTEITVLVLIGLNDMNWLSFWLYLPYPVWTTVAIYLNAQWAAKGLTTNNKQLSRI